MLIHVGLRETLPGKPLCTIAPGESNITAMALSTDHKWLAVGTSTGKMQVWDVEGRLLSQPPFTFKMRPTLAQFSPDGGPLAFVVGNALPLCDRQSDRSDLQPLPRLPGVAPGCDWIEFSDVIG